MDFEGIVIVICVVVLQVELQIYLVDLCLLIGDWGVFSVKLYGYQDVFEFLVCKVMVEW